VKFLDVEQNTDEWFALRAGKLTFSNLGKVMANLGKPFGEPAKQLAVNIAIEQITGRPHSSDYTNEHMQRGNEEEPVARELYEAETFTDVLPGGFYCDEFVGCSPDGRLDDGIIEIKSAIPSVHYARVKRQGLDPAYKWQCIGNLKLTDSAWLDFISYCSQFPEDKRLYVFRIWRKDFADEFSQITARVSEFKQLVQDTRRTIERSQYTLIAA
jgi:hypothetical protein